MENVLKPYNKVTLSEPPGNLLTIQVKKANATPGGGFEPPFKVTLKYTYLTL
jgi:hypothetical protein